MANQFVLETFCTDERFIVLLQSLYNLIGCEKMFHNLTRNGHCYLGNDNK